MKKIALLFVAVFAGIAIMNAQTAQTAESLLKTKAKSDADIENAKKKVKVATWEKRGNLFIDMAQFNTKGLYVGMQQAGIQGAKLLVGEPTETKATEKGEDWIYERVTLHFEGGKLVKWTETKPLDEKALGKAYEAFKKADELDEKKKFKNKATVKASISSLRELYRGRGIEYFNNKKYKESVEDLEKALELDGFPKAKGDTIFPTPLITYYTGLIAQMGEDVETAKKYFQVCIDKGYQEGAPYQALASIYKKEGNGEKELEILTQGREKYPESADILTAFINYYLAAGNSEEALKSLNAAIEKDPTNPSYHHAVGVMYDQMQADTTDKYNDEKKAEFMDKAIAAYKKALDLKDDNVPSIYNLGVIYFNKGVKLVKKAESYPLGEKAKYNATMEEANKQFEKSVPLMEKAHELEPSDRYALQNLLIIYSKLQKYDKRKEVKEKLEALPQEGGGL